MVPTPRTGPSIPARKIYELYPPSKPPQRLLDFGCGYGHDVRYFNEMGYKAEGFDPKTYPEIPEGKFDIVVATYVFGTIELRERAVAKMHMESFGHAGTIFVMSFRTWEDLASRRTKEWFKMGDGWITSTCQFHRGYDMKDVEKAFKSGLTNIKQIMNDGRILMVSASGPAWQSSAPDTAEQIGLTFDT